MTDEVGQRKVERPSASGIERSESCEASAVLPRPPPVARAHNAPSERGDRIHKALERYSMGARWEDVKHVVLHSDCYNLKEVCESIPKLTPIEDMPFVEVECWLNLMTGEAKLGVAEVPVDPGFWRGRADMIGWYDHPELGRIPCVEDHKTGNPNFQIDGGAKQLGYFATWLHIFMDTPHIYSWAYITQDKDQPRGHLWTPDEIVERFREMRNHELRLQFLERHPDLVPTYNPTQKNCHFCPVRSTCAVAYGKKAKSAEPREVRGSEGEGAVPAVREGAGEEGVRVLPGVPAVPEREEGRGGE